MAGLTQRLQEELNTDTGSDCTEGTLGRSALLPRRKDQKKRDLDLLHLDMEIEALCLVR